jgi:hypothetical protein
MSSQPKPRPKAKGGSLHDVLSASGAAAGAAVRKKKEPARREAAPAPPIITRSISFTPTALSTLDHFVDQLTRPRRTASRSGVVRALLAYASEKLDDKKLIEALNSELERETRTGEVVWGARPGEGK